MATQQGLAFLSGSEAQEALADPAQPGEVANANTSSAQQAGHDDHASGRHSFEALSKLSSHRLPNRAQPTGGTSRQALYEVKVRRFAPTCCACYKPMLRHLVLLLMGVAAVFVSQLSVTRDASE